ncbi:MAG: hypothetical protein HDS17_06300 [Bacteroides sp.]|nr:hypothetical protein [Bacteroides sp.]
MEKNQYIYALLDILDIYETARVFADYDLATSDYVCGRLMEDFYDERLDLVGIDMMIKQNVLEGESHYVESMGLAFKRCRLNCLFGEDILSEGEPLFDDPDFEVKKGAKIYEAAILRPMGGYSYALGTMGYFTRRVDSPEFRERKYEWKEWILE